MGAFYLGDGDDDGPAVKGWTLVDKATSEEARRKRVLV